MKNTYVVALFKDKAFLPVFSVALALSIYKLCLLEINSREILECEWCLAKKAIPHEVQFLLLVTALHQVSGIVSWFPSRLLFRLAVVGALLIASVDLVVLQQFRVRFTIHELLKFVGEQRAIRSFLAQLFAGNWSSLLVLLATGGIGALFLWYVFRKTEEETDGKPKVALLLGSCALIAIINPLKQIDFHTLYLSNAIEAFFSVQSRNHRYSEGFVANLGPAQVDAKRCYEGLGERPNLILLIVESLSMYHSRRFSGLDDWTPQFDGASDHGRRYMEFFANGINTEDGLIALLTGQPPLPKGLGESDTIYEEFSSVVDTLPRFLNGLGYRTLFLTTGNLGFLGEGKWLASIGFQHVEGHDAPYYAGMRRFHFDAAPDEALYGRAFQVLKQAHDKPFFMTLETVSTHHPYIDPENGTRSQENVFRYADRELGRFVGGLEQNGFFNDGFLIIVSDHRAMVPMQDAEYRQYGDQAYARIPFAIIGPHMEGEVKTRFSQTDLFPSLRHWLGKGRQCIDVNQSIFLPTITQAAGCILTRRSYNLDLVVAHCGDEDYRVLLDGDRTRYLGTPAGPAQLIDQINRLRVSTGF